MCCRRTARTFAGEPGLPEERRLQFRIGVHVGDVMVRDGDLLGDGVNIAARLQSLADPGGICLSEAAYGYVRKSVPLTFNDLGEQHVKNMEETIRAFAIALQSNALTAPRTDDPCPRYRGSPKSPPSLSCHSPT